MRLEFIAITCIIGIALSFGPICIAEEDKKTDAPQDFVACTGWHALCTNSNDCKMHGDKADCDCMNVNETHIVYTGEIQDAMVKNQTQTKCTNDHPCDMDEAPVCSAIKTGQYEVNGTKYDCVSTYSYRGWCSLLKRFGSKLGWWVSSGFQYLISTKAMRVNIAATVNN